MSTAHLFSPGDAVGKLKALGFLDYKDCPGLRYEMAIDDIQVTASITFDSVFMCATRITKREIAEMEVRVLIRAPIGSYAQAIAQIMRKFYPEIINRDEVWVAEHIARLGWRRPWVLVSRALLRRELKALKMRVNGSPLPDARMDYCDNAPLESMGELTIVIGEAVARLPASGIWVGRIWVKSRDLFKALEQRFQDDPVRILLGDYDARVVGKPLFVGSRAMRANWEVPLESSDAESVI